MEVQKRGAESLKEHGFNGRELWVQIWNPLALWLWRNYWTSSSLCFLIQKQKPIAPTFQGCCRVGKENAYNVPKHDGGHLTRFHVNFPSPLLVWLNGRAGIQKQDRGHQTKVFADL